MSRYFQVFERTGRNNELIPATIQPEPRVNAKRSLRSLDGLTREEVTKLVQRLFLLPGDKDAPRAVLFCNIEHGEGSTRICARAGQALAKLGKGTVCLIDANLRSPALHTILGVKNQRGLVDALFGAGSICDFAQPTPGNNLWLVPSGAIVPDAHTQLGGEIMQRCLAALRAQFNYLLIDAPAASIHADAAVVGKRVDGVVLVVEANATRRETTRQVKESLDAVNVRILGAVMENRSFPIPEAIYKRL